MKIAIVLILALATATHAQKLDSTVVVAIPLKPWQLAKFKEIETAKKEAIRPLDEKASNLFDFILNDNGQKREGILGVEFKGDSILIKRKHE